MNDSHAQVRHPWALLILLAVAMSMNFFLRVNLSVAAPVLGPEMKLSPQSLGLLLSAFYWTYAVGQIWTGWLVDRFDVRWVYTAAVLIWSMATFLIGITGSFAVMLCLLLLLGLGEAVAYPACSRVIISVFPETRRELGEFGHRYDGRPPGTCAWYPVRRPDGGQARLALAFPVIRRRRSGLADSLDVSRSTKAGASGARGHGGNRLGGPAAAACLVGHLLRAVRSKLRVVLPVELAAILSRQGATFLSKRDGGMGGGPIPVDGGYFVGRRDLGGPPDCARFIGRTCPPDVCLHGLAVDCASAAISADSSH